MNWLGHMGHKNDIRGVKAFKVLIFGVGELHTIWKRMDSTML